MTIDEAFEVVKNLTHTARAEDAVELIEKEYRELKAFREHWRASIDRAYSEPHREIKEDLDVC